MSGPMSRGPEGEQEEEELEVAGKRGRRLAVQPVQVGSFGDEIRQAGLRFFHFSRDLWLSGQKDTEVKGCREVAWNEDTHVGAALGEARNIFKKIPLTDVKIV